MRMACCITWLHQDRIFIQRAKDLKSPEPDIWSRERCVTLHEESPASRAMWC